MTNKDKIKLESIMENIRDFRDDVFCAYSEWQSKGEPDTDENIDCTCVKYDEILDQLETIKKGI